MSRTAALHTFRPWRAAHSRSTAGPRGAAATRTTMGSGFWPPMRPISTVVAMHPRTALPVTGPCSGFRILFRRTFGLLLRRRSTSAARSAARSVTRVGTTGIRTAAFFRIVVGFLRRRSFGSGAARSMTAAHVFPQLLVGLLEFVFRDLAVLVGVDPIENLVGARHLSDKRMSGGTARGTPAAWLRFSEACRRDDHPDRGGRQPEFAVT